MRASTSSKIAAAIAVPLLWGGLTACGGNDSGTPVTAQDPAGHNSAGQTPSPGSDITPADFTSKLTHSMGAFTTAHFTMTIAAGGLDMKAVGDVDYQGGANPSLEMTMSDPSGSGSMEMRLVDKVYYLKGGSFGGGKFIKLDLTSPGSPLAGLGSLTGSLDPRQAMQQFAPALTKVTFVGAEDVNGAQADHYKLVMDPSKVASLKTLGAAMPATVPYDMWLDDHSRPVQFTVKLPQVDLKMAYTKYGEPVDITAPDPSQVSDMPSMPALPSASS